MSTTMDELKKELEHLGMSDKESRVYLASLELGPSPVQDISHKAHVNRATTYVMIESLSARGLMSTFQKGKKKFYSAESPERLMTIIQRQQKELAEKEGELLKAMPMLEALYNAEGAKPQVRYLEGGEGVKTVRALFEKLSGDSVEIVPLDDVHQTKELMGRDREEHHASLKQRGIKYRILAVTSNQDPSCLPELGEGEWRMLPPERFPIHGSFVVRADYVFLFSYRSAILSVVIRSQEIADALRAIFDLAWDGAKDFPGKICKKE
jgi:HTH-type transcriptional regulator, sugar sensing transcriptional regulator